ncbi:aminopeptidase [Pseudomonas duriflava]|nr:aminopeptidase [Pseudomonas duriflava]
MSRQRLTQVDLKSLRWVPFIVAFWLSGCSSVGYYGQMVKGQIDLIRARQPIEQVIADPSTDARLRRRLFLALQARTFASQALWLPDNRSYRLYVQLDRPFVLWNLFATPEFSLAPRTYCFPIAGCVAYRGYYQEAAARAAAEPLKAQGWDTYVGGVPAYSTLGWFDDPILSSMMHWDDDRLISTIFHELAHQKLYVQDDTAFNESFATFVEREGLRQWHASRGLPPPDRQREAQYRQFVAFVLETRERLEHLYAQPLEASAMREAKAEAFQELRDKYARLRDSQWKGDRRFDAWMAGPLNNAALLPFGLYERWVPAFAALYAEHPGNWPAFYARVEALAALPVTERQARLEALANSAR